MFFIDYDINNRNNPLTPLSDIRIKKKNIFQQLKLNVPCPLTGCFSDQRRTARFARRGAKKYALP